MSYTSDVELLTKTIIEYWKDYDDGDNFPRYYCCKFCFGSSHKSHDDVSHDLNCIVLVAKDILTNNSDLNTAGKIQWGKIKENSKVEIKTKRGEVIKGEFNDVGDKITICTADNFFSLYKSEIESIKVFDFL